MFLWLALLVSSCWFFPEGPMATHMLLNLLACRQQIM